MRNDVSPEIGGRRIAVQEDDGIARVSIGTGHRRAEKISSVEMGVMEALHYTQIGPRSRYVVRSHGRGFPLKALPARRG